jgi:cyclic pyranopterin phosphate synthase
MLTELRDEFGREIRYLRVSVTDRCNLNCVYCRPELNHPELPASEILSFEEIYEVVKTAVEMGVDKVRLTGGEPLRRRNVITLVRMIGSLPGIRDYAMTTNGVLLEGLAKPLRDAGLHRINVSLDAVDPDRYRERTGGGDVRAVLAGIRAARAAGLEPIKLNCVIEESPDEPDAKQVAAFAAENDLTLRYIRKMDIAAGRFWPVQGGQGGRCGTCSRLRLTCNGMIRPCLFSDLAFSVRELGARRAIERAVEAKPKSGETSRESRLYRIGG